MIEGILNVQGVFASPNSADTVELSGEAERQLRGDDAVYYYFPGTRNQSVSLVESDSDVFGDGIMVPSGAPRIVGPFDPYSSLRPKYLRTHPNSSSSGTVEIALLVTQDDRPFTNEPVTHESSGIEIQNFMTSSSYYWQTTYQRDGLESCAWKIREKDGNEINYALLYSVFSPDMSDYPRLSSGYWTTEVPESSLTGTTAEGSFEQTAYMVALGVKTGSGSDGTVDASVVAI